MAKIKQSTDIQHYSSLAELESRNNMLGLMQSCPIPKEQMLSNIGLFIDSKNLSDFCFWIIYIKRLLMFKSGDGIWDSLGSNGAVF